VDELLAEEQRKGGIDEVGFRRHKSEKVMNEKSVTKCKPYNGFITSSDRINPGGVLLSIAHFRFIR